jgi:hypothetical protein
LIGHSCFVIGHFPRQFVPGQWTFFLAWLRRARACPKNGRPIGLNPALLLLLFKPEMIDLRSAAGYFGAVTIH